MPTITPQEPSPTRYRVAVIHCLGAGLVGSYVAKRLAGAGHEVHVYDWQPHRVMGVTGIHVHPEDATDAVGGMSGNGVVDMVVNMLPGSIGHVASTYLAESSYRIVDLSFSKFTPDRDDEKARDYGASILWDVGVAPGLSNMLLAVADRKMGPLAKAEVWVGGNPTGPYGEWSYMAPFSPTDVIAEYSRPARVIRDGEQVVLPALSQRHLINVGERGEMEAFLTDGLRSVLSSIPAVEMSEFTVRWPGHIQKYIDERDAGTLDEEDVVRQWWYDHKIPEFTWMRVRAQNRKGEVMEWELEDYGGDDGHSMARSTGLVTACCIEAWLADPNMLPAGVHAPEVLSSEVISGIVETMRSVGVRIEGPDIL